MNQYSNPLPTPPSISAPPGSPPPGGRIPVVHVVSKPGGFWRAVMIVIGMFTFAAVFIIGLTFGIIIMVAGASMDSVMVRESFRDGSSNRSIAIIPIEGVIDDRQAHFMRAATEHVLEDRNIRAVVLRVDSPGGGVTASDQIWYEVERLKKSGLPVIASYGSVAASGGYYVSCAADHIIAEETSITGSIGVIAQVLTMEDLMQKIGVQPVTMVATNSPEKAVANDIFRDWNDKDIETVRTMLDAAYQIFNTRVRDGRKAVLDEPSMVDALANGDIYTAMQAKENGLIDGIGYLSDAVGIAESRAKLQPGSAEVFIVRNPPTLADALMGVRAANPATKSLDADSIRTMVNDLASPRVMYLMR